MGTTPIAEEKAGFLIDLDGVIDRGSRPLRGTSEFVAHLAEAGHPFLFVTNDSQRTRRDVCARLRRHGIVVEETNVFTCALAAARFLARQKPKGSAFVIGEGGLLNALHQSGYVVDDRNPDYVIVGEGTSLSMDMLEKAVNHVNAGARLVATTLDANRPTEHGMRPGCGAIVAILERATGKKALGLGKPSPITMSEAARELRSSRVVVVGDTMETDILGGVQLGFTTVLVQGGASRRSSIEGYPYRPTYVVKSMAELGHHEVLGSGTRAA